MPVGALDDLSVEVIEGRNRVIVLEFGDRAVVVKQFAGSADCEREARTIRRLSSVGRLSVSLPRLVTMWEPSSLVFSGEAALAPVTERYRGKVPLARAAGARLGRFLAGLHAVAAGDAAGADPQWLLRAAAGAPPSFVVESPAALEVVRRVQQSAALCHASRALFDGSDHRTSRVHGDMKLANCLVPRSGANRGALVIVDWELSGAGDPAADLGSAAGSIAERWLSGSADKARCHAVVEALWSGYRSVAGSAAPPASRWVPHAGARLLQSAFERCAAGLSYDSGSDRLLRGGIALIARPLEGCAHVLGVTPG